MSDKYSDGSIIIGGTTGAWAFGSNTVTVLDREFSYVTPENDGICIDRNCCFYNYIFQ